MPEAKPMSMRRFATLWYCEAEWEPDGKQSVHIWEPLDVDAPADAHPSCGPGPEITFYDRTGNKLITRHVRHYDLTGLEDLVLLDGTWWEVISGRPVYRNGRWYMRWWGQKNTRFAIMANAGYWAFQDPELGVAVNRAMAKAAGERDLTARQELGEVRAQLRQAQKAQDAIHEVLEHLRADEPDRPLIDLLLAVEKRLQEAVIGVGP